MRVVKKFARKFAFEFAVDFLRARFYRMDECHHF